MGKILVDILALNEMLNYQVILSCLFVYILLFWGAICAWVYFDALKRYQGKYTSYAIALLVFFFSFPALILYLVLRREDVEHTEGLEFENLHVPSIPIADLTQDGDIKFKLEMTIVPVGKVQEVHKNDKGIIQTEDSIKVKLVQYMNDRSNSTSELDKRIKKSISKLLKLIKNRESKPHLN